MAKTIEKIFSKMLKTNKNKPVKVKNYKTGQEEVLEGENKELHLRIESNMIKILTNPFDYELRKQVKKDLKKYYDLGYTDKERYTKALKGLNI